MCGPQVKEAAIRTFGPVLYEFYGSSEMGINTFLRPEVGPAAQARMPLHVCLYRRQDVLRKLGSCGVAAPGVELAILDERGNRLGPNQEGELYVRRNGAMFDGYYGDQEKTAKCR
jgi:long-chain acyl-CoA synthetase